MFNTLSKLTSFLVESKSEKSELCLNSELRAYHKRLDSERLTYKLSEIVIGTVF